MRQLCTERHDIGVGFSGTTRTATLNGAVFSKAATWWMSQECINRLLNFSTKHTWVIEKKSSQCYDARLSLDRMQSVFLLACQAYVA
jgi:hypothetical protein